jgi:hypothetical protein
MCHNDLSEKLEELAGEMLQQFTPMKPSYQSSQNT